MDTGRGGGQGLIGHEQGQGPGNFWMRAGAGARAAFDRSSGQVLIGQRQGQGPGTDWMKAMAGARDWLDQGIGWGQGLL